MKQSTKLFLDILMGAVIPILVLNFLTKPLGAPVAYVVAALIPVAWVMVDLLVITRAFNFITSYAGLTALISGALAFWFVDGVRYAVKDTASLFVTILLFGGSVLVRHPILQYFFRQVVGPDTPAREESLRRIFADPGVHRALTLGTVVVAGQSAVSAAVNFFLNLRIVLAPFGTEDFNRQVAEVNAISRIIFPVLAVAGFAGGIWLVYRAVYRLLPSEEGKPQFESEFWTLVEMREGRAPAPAAPPEDGLAPDTGA